MTSSRALTATTLALLTALTLAGCSSATPAEPGATTAAPAPDGGATTEPDAGATDAPSPEPTRVTCDSLVDADTLAMLHEQGWTYEQQPFEIAGTTLSEGLSCMWADFEVASGDLLIFAWAPVTAQEAKTLTQKLVEAGGTVIPDAGGDYVTEDPEQSPTTDENGYGFTYQFGDGWVTAGDTMQTLLLVQRPAS